MKDVFKGIGILLGIIALVYVIWIAFIPMLIGEKIVERKVIEQSPQYVTSQRSALFEMYAAYTEADGAHKQAIKSQMCEIAVNLSINEWPQGVSTVCR